MTHFLSRRLIAIASLLLLLTTAPVPVLAGGEPSHFKRFLTWSDLTQFTPAEIDTVYRAYLNTPNQPVIKGFSKPMTGWLFHMAHFKRVKTGHLIRDMAALEGQAVRRARLKREVMGETQMIKRLKASIRQMQTQAASQGRDNVITAYQTRLWRSQNYLKGVGIWRKHPNEGRK